MTREQKLEMQMLMKPLTPSDLPVFDGGLQPTDVVEIYREPISREGCEGRAVLRRKVGEFRLSDGNRFERWELSFVGSSDRTEERWIRIDANVRPPYPVVTRERRAAIIGEVLDVTHATAKDYGALAMDLETARGLLDRVLHALRAHETDEPGRESLHVGGELYRDVEGFLRASGGGLSARVLSPARTEDEPTRQTSGCDYPSADRRTEIRRRNTDTRPPFRIPGSARRPARALTW